MLVEEEECFAIMTASGQPLCATNQPLPVAFEDKLIRNKSIGLFCSHSNHGLIDDDFWQPVQTKPFKLNLQARPKGRHPQKKTVYFWALPELATPSPQFGQRFARMTEKSDNDDNDGCNDNYDSIIWNFDENYERKNY